jgi:hypothetical protein
MVTLHIDWLSCQNYFIPAFNLRRNHFSTSMMMYAATPIVSTPNQGNREIGALLKRVFMKGA